jgi:predicted transcriptional regulator YdeE
MVTEPKLVDLEEKRCIGYMITTSFKGNQKKKDIPPFWHDIYDNDKLSALKKNKDDSMYCIFKFHSNAKDFDYYVAVENKAGISGEGYSEISLPKGRYVQVEFMKRNQTAAALIAGYLKKFWIELNGYKERNSPAFILYDERFDRNYKKYGCKGKDYLGDPLASMHVPLEP